MAVKVGNKRILLIGPPCAGKSTVGGWLSKSLGLPFLSMGNIYRSNKHRLHPDTVARVDAGGLMSDEEVMSFLLPSLHALDAGNGGGWVLDGVPRTVGQARALREHCDVVYSFKVSDEELRARMKDRLFHPRSGRTYSSFAPSQTPGIDDITGDRLERRDDDSDQVFDRRLGLHHATIGEIEEALGGEKLVRVRAGCSQDFYDEIMQGLRGTKV